MGIPNSIARDSLEYFHANVELFNIKTATPLVAQFAGVQQETSQTSALMIAARKGFTQIIPLLLDKELKLKDAIGQTALHKALIHGQTAAAMLLRAERDICDATGTTCLMFAAMSGRTQMLSEFIEQLHQKDNMGRTALMKATIYNREDCIEKLVDETREVDKNGLTACALAAQRGYWKIVGKLFPLEGQIADCEGKTVKDLAAQMEQYETVVYIEDGAQPYKKLPRALIKKASEMKKQIEKERLQKEEQEFLEAEAQAKANQNAPGVLSTQVEAKFANFQKGPNENQQDCSVTAKPIVAEAVVSPPVQVNSNLLSRMNTSNVGQEPGLRQVSARSQRKETPDAQTKADASK